MTQVPIKQKKQAKVKTPESGVLRACLDLLAAEHIWHCRMNTGAVKSGKRFFHFGRPGMADILATIEDEIEPIIIVLWIECKSESGRQTLEQLIFQREVKENGHNYLLVRDVDTLKNWLKEHGAI